MRSAASSSPIIIVPTAGSGCPGSANLLPEGGGEVFNVGVETMSGSRDGEGSEGRFSSAFSSRSDGEENAGNVVSDSNPMLAQVAVLLKSQAEAQAKAVRLQLYLRTLGSIDDGHNVDLG